MRIGIDARELCGHRTGAGRYLSGLLTEWSSDAAGRRHEFVLYAPEPVTLALDTHRFATRHVPGRPTVWWEQLRLARAARTDHLDLFFAPAYSAPLALGVPTVVAIHDVSFAAHPEWFTTREGVRRRFVTRRSAARAAAVVTISEFSRGEIVEHLGVAREKIHVIPPGVSARAGGARFKPSRDTEPSGPATILYVGSIFNRRHVPDLIRAFRNVHRAHPETALDLVGDNRSYPREDIVAAIEREQVGSAARWHAYATDADLQAFYDGARAFAFLSEYEGLGWPPLEALASGAVPVLLDTPVARESCGNAAVYVATTAPPAVAQALERALFDEPTRRAVFDAAPAVLAKYSWPRAANETLALLESASADRD